MNRTIISIEVQDHDGKEANIIVRGERNNQILFEEHFAYQDDNKHSLRLHLLIDKYLRNITKGKDMATMCIRKLLNDITERSHIKANTAYRVRDKQV